MLRLPPGPLPQSQLNVAVSPPIRPKIKEKNHPHSGGGASFCYEEGGKEKLINSGFRGENALQCLDSVTWVAADLVLISVTLRARWLRR